MRIAQVSPLYESVPPKSYGGTERVVSYLTEELIRRGHDVTLFASGDSVTRARLVPISDRAIRFDATPRDTLALHLREVREVFARRQLFDVIHFHTGYLHLPSAELQDTACVTTLHGPLAHPDLLALLRAFPQATLVSISDAQRGPLPGLNWQATVHHALPSDLYSFHDGYGGYLAFVGRISPEKRADRAVEIARRAGMPLRVAAKVDKVDRDYYEREIAPLFADPLVEYVGEIGEREKADFMGNAAAVLFPVDWPEPFGLVMIEAMATGTPVITRPRGAVPEVILPGRTGFIAERLEDLVAAVHRVASLDRAACRAHVEARFSVRRMVDDYEAVYRRLVFSRRSISRRAG